MKKHIEASYRSGLEEKIALQLEKLGVQYEYEKHKITYTVPVSTHRYTPDFLVNGMFIETKGIFTREDRQKHLYIQEQYPELDIRIVFSNASAKLYKGSKTTYGDWCTKNGILWANKSIPMEWLTEKD